MENIIQKAIGKAIELHHGQVRKGDFTPYVIHPLEVGFTVSRYTSDDGLIAAAMLHDTVEDCGYKIEDLKREFGDEVAKVVAALTEDKAIGDWSHRKAENLERIKNTQHAPFIKAADALANMQSLIRALKAEGSMVWDRFNAPKGLKCAYFRSILEMSRNGLPPEMIERYVSALKDLEYSDRFEAQAIGFTRTPLLQQ